MRILFLMLISVSPAIAAPPVFFDARPVVPERTEANLEAARTAVDGARAAFAANQLPRAMTFAEEAFRLRPNASTALFYATILERAKRPCAAFRYLLLARDLDATSAELRRVDTELATTGRACGDGYGWLTVRVTPVDARLVVADVPVGSGRTIGLIAGKHDLTASAGSYATSKSRVQIRAGRSADIELVLSPEEPGVTVVASDEPTPWRRPTAITLTAIGGASLLTGVVLMGVAGKRREDAATFAVATGNPAEDAARRADYNDAVADMETLWPTGLVMGLVGLGAVSGGIALLLTGEESPPAAIHVDPDGARVVFQGRF